MVSQFFTFDIKSSIVDGFNLIVEAIGGFFEDIEYIAILTAKFSSKVPSFLGYLPDPIISIIVVGVSIVVIYKILGREG